MLKGDYSETLFDTEARILAENDRHLVIALRLDKNTLRRNMHFTAALADALDEKAERPVGAGQWRRRANAIQRIAGKAALLLMHPLAMATNWVLTILLLT